jgi:hypothetical protein
MRKSQIQMFLFLFFSNFIFFLLFKYNLSPPLVTKKRQPLSVGIIVIDVKGSIMSLMSYYSITIHTSFPRLICVCVCVCVCLQVYLKGVHVKI